MQNTEALLLQLSLVRVNPLVVCGVGARQLRLLIFLLLSLLKYTMGKKEEEEIIRIAKKIDKMAQKKNAVRFLSMVE